jgi:hypothetical protein
MEFFSNKTPCAGAGAGARQPAGPEAGESTEPDNVWFRTLSTLRDCSP